MKPSFKYFVLLALMIFVFVYFVESRINTKIDRQDIAICEIANDERQELNDRYEVEQNSLDRSSQAFRTLAKEIVSPVAQRQLVVSADELDTIAGRLNKLPFVACEDITKEKSYWP